MGCETKMGKQELINYCICRDFSYADVLVVGLRIKCEDFPTVTEYTLAYEKFNEDLVKEYNDVPFTDAELG